ncbi:MAG: SpoIID/LytB domain-containing protein [Chloroflexi bacterium]|nr:SpoIID/LytB domain-containing protein [Chloroflexota bacterium]
MSRPNAGRVCVLALALLSMLAIPAPARAATSCTGWASELVPPTTVRVKRTEGPAAGRVQTVPFHDYVDVVMHAEWPASWRTETLKAGAVAVKQYAWYHAMNYRGGYVVVDGRQVCYDVVDTWADQLYHPERFPAGSVPGSLKSASRLTWQISLRKAGAFFLTGYHAGEIDATCGSNATGIRIYQWSAENCGDRGYSMESILRTYYSGLSVVDPGAHDILGSSHGDGAVTAPTSGSTIRPRIFRSTGQAFTPVAGPEAALDPDLTLAKIASDVTGDGRDDLVVLLRDGSSGHRLSVMTATPTGLLAPRTWWLSGGDFAGRTVRLSAGGFTTDRRMDVGLLVEGADSSRSNVYMLRSLGDRFSTKDLWWSGALNAANTSIRAGDVTGDGRADLVLQLDRGTSGLSYDVMRSRHGGGALGSRVRWFDGTGLRRATTRLTISDVNRDGRDDLLLAYPRGSSGTYVTGLVSDGSRFREDAMWSSTTLPYARVKLGAGDIDANGRGDGILYYRTAEGTTRLYALRSSGGAMSSAVWLTDSARWSRLTPY